jgi:hypothetical protein
MRHSETGGGADACVRIGMGAGGSIAGTGSETDVSTRAVTGHRSSVSVPLVGWAHLPEPRKWSYGISTGSTHLGVRSGLKWFVWVGSRTGNPARTAPVRLGRSVRLAGRPIFWPASELLPVYLSFCL